MKRKDLIAPFQKVAWVEWEIMGNEKCNGKLILVLGRHSSLSRDRVMQQRRRGFEET